MRQLKLGAQETKNNEENMNCCIRNEAMLA